MTGTTFFNSVKSIGVLKWGGLGLAFLIALPAGFVATHWWWAHQNSQLSPFEINEIERANLEKKFDNKQEGKTEVVVSWAESIGRVDAGEAISCEPHELDTENIESKKCFFLDDDTKGELMQPD